MIEYLYFHLEIIDNNFSSIKNGINKHNNNNFVSHSTVQLTWPFINRIIITMDFQIVYDIVMHKRNVYQFNEETLENDQLCKKIFQNITK